MFILFFFIYKKINFAFLIGLTSPAALISTSLLIYLYPEATHPWGGRLSTFFVDPNALGAYSAVLTTFCLFHLDLSPKTSKLWLLYQLIGIIFGLYLVLGSLTRGSWLSIPFIIAIWLFFNYRKLSAKFYIIAITTLILLSILIHFVFPHLGQRFLSGFHEVNNWLNHTQLDSSTGLRLSIWEISWQLFLHQPFFGYGETGFVDFLNQPWLSSTGTSAAKSMLACCGVHNELLANMIRSGVFGAISSLSLFFVPLFIFIRYSHHQNTEISQPAQLGLAFLCCLGICSLSIEVLNLKYEYSFFSLIITGLVAQLVRKPCEIDKHTIAHVKI
jgi:O-antigen ligase